MTPRTPEEWFVSSIKNKIPEAVELRKVAIPEGYYHLDYFGYLKDAYNGKLEIVLTPDIVWFTLLIEVARIIDANPEAYRKKFTYRSKDEADELKAMGESGKIEIKIKTQTPQDLPTYIDMIIDKLKCLVPNNLSDKILIDFSTITSMTRLAQHAAFTDMVRHYYAYTGCQGCQGSRTPPDRGILQVHLKGTKEDWSKLHENWDSFTREIFGCMGEPELMRYLSNVSYSVLSVLDSIASLEYPQNFLRRIYYEDEREQPQGWFMNLYAPDCVKGHISTERIAKVPYKAIYLDGSSENFSMVLGVFSSHLDDKILIPEFGHIIFTRDSEKGGEG